MKIKISAFTILLLFVLAHGHNIIRGDYKEILVQPEKNGTIPSWLVAGPFEFPVVGFGSAADTNAIGEPDVSPSEGDQVTSSLADKEIKTWFPQTVDKKGFLDFNKSIEWDVNKNLPVKFWFVKAGYAYVTVYSDKDQDAVLSTGSNSHIKVFLNKELVFSFFQERNAIADQDKIKIKLKKGANDLLVRVYNTNKNLGLAFFGFINWEWGFYARLLDKEGKPLTNVKYGIRSSNYKNDFNVISTFFFKKENGQLKQRIDVDLNSSIPGYTKAVFKLTYKGKPYKFSFDSLAYGITRHSIFIPEIRNTYNAEAVFEINGQSVNKNIRLEERKKYKLHLMLLNHTDIGYTHPQPVVEEIHCNTLDSVITMCKNHPDFHWTIETTWQLYNYEKSRSKENFLKLIELIKSGRVALSPIFSNPYTGYVSEEEMIRSFDKAIEYKEKYGIYFDAAVYNDVPGQSWIIPNVLPKAGVKFLADGINEFYGGFRYQKALPKTFKWQANDGSEIVTYITEAYNEGKSYGLESNNLLTVEQKLWEHINMLEARNYDPDIILLNSSYTDNSILASHQYLLAEKWNEVYEYPKFISSNVSRFANELIKSSSYKKLPVLKGDWTSDWDILSQGEYERNKKIRWNQHQLLSAEKLSTLSNLLDKSKRPMNNDFSGIYSNMLLFDGHGSGLEYGYGSPELNLITMEFRGNYVEDAYLGVQSALLRSMHRLTTPEETFESEGLYIFNTLSWQRSEVVEFQHTFDSSPNTEVVDAETKKIIPSFRKGHKQYFLAENVPSFGYKKYLLRPQTISDTVATGLSKTENTIENKYYKITVAKSGKSICSIIDKKRNKELINNSASFGFAEETVQLLQQNKDHAAVPKNKVSYEIKDESPIRLNLIINSEGEVIEKTTFTLEENIDKVFVTSIVNLEAMKSPAVYEEYGLPFEFDIPKANAKVEILGGFIDLNKDRFAGVNHDAVSMRRGISIYNDKENVIWATADARVARIRTDKKNSLPVIISNPVNNFPKNWNRNEILKGTIEYRYAFSSGEGSFDPAKTTEYGYELNTPMQVRKSWYRSKPAQDEYLTIDNKNIVLMNLKSTGKGFILRLINSDNQNKQTANIKSKFFAAVKGEFVDLLGNVKGTIEVKDNIINTTLKPGEITDILITKEIK